MYRVLILLAKYKASRGDVDGALQLLADVHMIGVHHTAVPLLSQLTGAAICKIAYDAIFAIMDRCQVNKKMLRQTFDVYASRLPQTRVPRFTEVEHLLLHDHMQRVFTDDGDGNGRLIPALMYEWKKKGRESPYGSPISFLDAVRVGLTHPSREETTRLSDAYYAVVKGLVGQSPWDLHAQDTCCYEIIDELLSENYYLHDLAVPIADCIDIGWQDRAHGEGVVTVLAILAYRTQEERLPGSLEQLVAAGLLQEVPMDPYSSGPLVYQLTGEDFTLYSVGEDFVDDEGVHCEWNDWGGGDHVFWPVQYPDEIEEGE